MFTKLYKTKQVQNVLRIGVAGTCSSLLRISYHKTTTYNKSFISSACRLLNSLWVLITNECSELSLPGFATVGIAFQLVHDAGSTQGDVSCYWLSWKSNHNLKLQMWFRNYSPLIYNLTTSTFMYLCFQSNVYLTACVEVMNLLLASWHWVYLAATV